MASSYEFTHTETTSAAPATVFALWSDVASWPSWDAGVTAVELTGPFAVGSTGTMHLTDQPAVAFTLTEVTPGRGFTDETPIPGGVLRFTHTAEPGGDGGTLVTHRVEIEGAREMAGELGPMVTEDTPASVAALVALAERAEREPVG